MTDTPNQTQIEPSEEAINKAYVHVNRRLAENYDVEQMSTLLAVAYAIDLAPIIAERDQLKAENKKLLEEGAELAAGQCIVDGALVGDERGNLVCTVLVERDRMKAALKIIETASRAYERGEIPMVEHFLKALWAARDALKDKP